MNHSDETDINNKPSVESLRKDFKETMNTFLDACIPLGSIENYLHFMSTSGQLYGFDTKRNIIFEPNASNKYKLIDEYIDVYFTNDIKKSLEERIGLQFSDLVELLLRPNQKEKHIGKKFFYSKSHNQIYIWSMTTSKWEKSDVEQIKYYFKNSEVFETNAKPIRSMPVGSVESFDDFGIEFEELQEINERFRDASIHYLHPKTNKIYSMNIIKNYWYIPEETVQRQILSRIQDKNAIN